MCAACQNAGEMNVVSLKAFLRPLIPPLIYEAAHRVKVSAGYGLPPPLPLPLPLPPTLPPPEPLTSYSPRSSFAEAAEEAGAGYSSQSILAEFRPGVSMMDLPAYTGPMLACMSLVAQKNRPIKVCDFGGSTGYFRSYVETFFNGSVATHWRVVETAEQVQRCADAKVPGLAFSTSIGPAPYDVAIFSGALHCIDDWKAPLREVYSEFILICRTPLDDEERPFLQSFVREGITHTIAGRVLRRKDIFDLLSATHELLVSWEHTSHLCEMGPFSSPTMLWRRRERDD
jgi:putative methyltransferase (TIGR04325 family)